MRNPRRFATLFVWLLLLIVVGAGRLVAAPPQSLSIPTVVAAAGETVTTSVNYRTGEAAVAAMQFDLRYDRNVLTVTATIGSAAAASGKTLASAVLPNGDTRFIVFGLNQNVIGDGSVVDLTITVSANPAAGPYALHLLNALGASPAAQGVPIAVRSGRVIVR